MVAKAQVMQALPEMVFLLFQRGSPDFAEGLLPFLRFCFTRGKAVLVFPHEVRESRPDHPVSHPALLLKDRLDATYFLPVGLASKRLCILEILSAE